LPVICSNQASLPEVAGDAAASFIPLSVDEMVRTVAEVGMLAAQAEIWWPNPYGVA